MRVLVCGGRDYADANTMKRVLGTFHTLNPIAVLIHGGAPGADTMAGIWALYNGITERVFLANWKDLGKKAGPIRNQQMLDEGKPDLVIAFPGGSGTSDMIRRAEKAGVTVHQVPKVGA